jgi:hypothetical protein
MTKERSKSNDEDLNYQVFKPNFIIQENIF